MKKIITLIATVVLCSFCSIQAQGWNTVEFPIEENINGASFVNADTAFFVTNQGKLLRTFDRLKSFDTFNPAPGVSLEDVFFINSDIGFICGSKGTLMRTTDGGYTFENINIVDSIPWLFDIELFDNSHGLVIGLSRSQESPYGGIIYRTSDAGKTWTKVEPFGLGYSEIEYVNKKIYVQSFGRINYSSDFGKTWHSDSTVAGSPGRSFSIYKNNGILCGIRGMCAYTQDGGKSWISNYQDTTKLFVASQMIDDNEGFIGGAKSFIKRTTDGGKTWSDELMAKSFDVYDFVLVDDRLYAVGANGGIIWKKVK